MTAQEVLDAARAANLRIAVAESCTGGLLAAALTDPAGASDVLEAGFVTYSNAAKTALLGVPEALIAADGAVSETVAAAMADGARARTGAGIAVSITGIAGPGGSGHKPEGRVCFGCAGPAGTRTLTEEFGPRGRAAVRAAATGRALELLAEAIAQAPPQP